MEAGATVAEMLQAQIEEFEGFDRPLYGLDASWTGFRFLDGYERAAMAAHADGAVLSASIAFHLGHTHSESDSTSNPFVTVTTKTAASLDDEDLPWHLIVRAEKLPADVEKLFSSDDGPRGAERIAALRQVAGTDVEFDVLQRNGCFAAKGVVGSELIIVVGSGVDFADLIVAPVSDLSPYVEGFRQVARRNGSAM